MISAILIVGVVLVTAGILLVCILNLTFFWFQSRMSRPVIESTNQQATIQKSFDIPTITIEMSDGSYAHNHNQIYIEPSRVITIVENPMGNIMLATR